MSRQTQCGKKVSPVEKEKESKKEAGKKPKKGHLLWWVLLGVLGVALVGGGIWLAATGRTPGGGGEITVSDVYEGQREIPRFQLEKNRYSSEKFKVKDGYLQYDDPAARLGVDVSEYQGEIDWKQVKDAGMDFAMLRIGYRGMTEGRLNADESFERNFTGATDAGLFVGAYFFSQAVTEEEAREEADFVISLLGGRKLAYPIVFDWEIPDPAAEDQEQFRVHGAEGEQITRCSVAFCERIKEAGYTPMVYTNKHLAYEFFDMSLWHDYDLWYAEYQDKPSLYYDFRMWQYADDGVVPGIENGVDLNICFKPY